MGLGLFDRADGAAREEHRRDDRDHLLDAETRAAHRDVTEVDAIGEGLAEVDEARARVAAYVEGGQVQGLGEKRLKQREAMSVGALPIVLGVEDRRLQAPLSQRREDRVIVQHRRLRRRFRRRGGGVAELLVAERAVCADQPEEPRRDARQRGPRRRARFRLLRLRLGLGEGNPVEANIEGRAERTSLAPRDRELDPELLQKVSPQRQLDVHRGVDVGHEFEAQRRGVGAPVVRASLIIRGQHAPRERGCEARVARLLVSRPDLHRANERLDPTQDVALAAPVRSVEDVEGPQAVERDVAQAAVIARPEALNPHAATLTVARREFNGHRRPPRFVGRRAVTLC